MEAVQDANAVVQDGNATPQVDNAWLSSVPENLRSNEILKGHASLGEALQSYVDTKVKSADMLTIPGEDATPEQIQEFRTKLGVPETVEGYEIAKPVEWPKKEDGTDKYVYDEEFHVNMVKILHELGAPKNSAQTIMKAFHDYQIATYRKFDAWNAEREKNETEALQKIWGDKFELKNRETKEVLKRHAESLNIPDELGGMEGYLDLIKGIQSNPLLNFIMNDLFSRIGDDSFIPSSSGAGTGDWLTGVNGMYPGMKA